MTNNKNNTEPSIPTMLVLGAIFLSAVGIVAYYWFRASSSNPVATPTPTVNSGTPLVTPLSPDRERGHVNYSKLEEYLQKKKLEIS